MPEFKRMLPFGLLVFVCGSLVTVGLIFGIAKETDEQTTEEEYEYTNDRGVTEPPPSQSLLGVYENAAVSADGVPCAQIGTDILQRNGTAVDAAIASLFCLGVVNAQSTGIGGGFLLTYYEKSSGLSYTLDAREVAPGAAYEDMYVDDPSLSQYGGLAVAVPGETRGYWRAYQRFGGGVNWADIIEPTINLCEQGFPVNYHMANCLQDKEDHILQEPSMSKWINNETGHVWQEGDTIYRNDLVPTLRTLQTEPEALYNGSLVDIFLQDLEDLGTIITREDLMNYNAEWKDPINIQLSNGDYTIHSFPPPGSGVIYSFILNVLDNYGFTPESLNDTEIVTTYQRIVEAFKYAYAEKTEMGDPAYEDMSGLIANLTSEAYAFDIYSKITDNQTFQSPRYYGVESGAASKSHGTSHLSVVAPNGDAVAVTGTVNWYFGAVIMSVNTGIVLNNEMDDFSTPNDTYGAGLTPSDVNFIEPGKRPVSSMSPSILVDSNGDVRLAIGAAGGSHIITATAWASMHNRWFGLDIKEAIDERRLHHKLMPMLLQYEEEFLDSIIAELEAIGHITAEYEIGTSVVCGISREEDGMLYANSDFRKRGEVDGF